VCSSDLERARQEYVQRISKEDGAACGIWSRTSFLPTAVEKQ
jgi:hypothetical protein